jgi:hypothetical protein
MEEEKDGAKKLIVSTLTTGNIFLALFSLRAHSHQ